MEFDTLSQNIIDKTIKAGATDCDVVLAKGSSRSISELVSLAIETV